MLNLLAATTIALTTPKVTPTATPSATPTEDINFEDKIKSAVAKNLATAEAELKNKLNIKNLVGYSGKIADIKQTTLTLTSKDNETFQLGLDKNTSIVKNGSDIKLTSLAINDQVIAIGTATNDDIINLKRLVVFTPPTVESTKKIIIATVTSLNSKAKSVILTDTSNQTYTISLKSDSPLKFDSLEPGQKLLGIVKTNVKTQTTTLIKAKTL